MNTSQDFLVCVLEKQTDLGWFTNSEEFSKSQILS